MFSLIKVLSSLPSNRSGFKEKVDTYEKKVVSSKEETCEDNFRIVGKRKNRALRRV